MESATHKAIGGRGRGSGHVHSVDAEKVVYGFMKKREKMNEV